MSLLFNALGAIQPTHTLSSCHYGKNKLLVTQSIAISSMWCSVCLWSLQKYPFKWLSAVSEFIAGIQFRTRSFEYKSFQRSSFVNQNWGPCLLMDSISQAFQIPVPNVSFYVHARGTRSQSVAKWLPSHHPPDLYDDWAPFPEILTKWSWDKAWKSAF